MTKYGDVIAASLFVLFALGGITMSLQLPLGTALEPMPGFVPLTVSIFLLCVSLVQLAAAFRHTEITIDPVGKHWKQPAAMILGLLIYSMTLDYLGYIVATAGLSLLIMRILEPRSWRGPVVVSLALTAFSYVLFDRVLDIDLPEGILTTLLK